MHELNRIPAGQARRDCEPHRGPFLKLLGAAGVLLGLSSVCLLIPSAIAFPLALWVWAKATEDLQKMQLGLMDPAGHKALEDARVAAITALLLCLLSWTISAFLLYYAWPHLLGDFPDR